MLSSIHQTTVSRYSLLVISVDLDIAVFSVAKLISFARLLKRNNLML